MLSASLRLCVILSFLFLYLLASAPRTRRNAHNPSPFSHLLHNSRTPPGAGYPTSPSVNSVHSALKPTRSYSPVDPFDAKAPTPSLTPLSATLTKNRGEGAKSASGPCRVVLPWMTASSMQLLNLELFSLRSCELLALSLDGSAVSPVAAKRKSFIRNAYKKAGGRWHRLQSVQTVTSPRR